MCVCVCVCVAPRIVTAACYRELKEKMKLLWTKDLQMNTVHVSDVVSALWHLSTAGSTGEVYNLADQGFTSESALTHSHPHTLTTAQGKISQLVSTLFGIQHDYFGTVLSNLARVRHHPPLYTLDYLCLSVHSSTCALLRRTRMRST